MKRVLGCGAVGLVLVCLFFGLLAWALWIHTRLARAERTLDRAWTEIEREYRQRDEVLADFLEASGRERTASPEAIERVEAARREASEVLPTPELITDAERLARFCRLQEAVDAARRGLGDDADLASSDRRMIEKRFAFDDVAAAYNDALAHPPSSWIGSLAGYRPAARFEAVCGDGRL